MPDKLLPLTKAMVWKAYQRVKQNGKAAGVDGQSLDDFKKDLVNNHYRLCNRMASGSYLPPPVRRVEIPKSGGGIRPLGIPTVADRVAQTVVKRNRSGGCREFLIHCNAKHLPLSMSQCLRSRFPDEGSFDRI